MLNDRGLLHAVHVFDRIVDSHADAAGAGGADGDELPRFLQTLVAGARDAEDLRAVYSRIAVSRDALHMTARNAAAVLWRLVRRCHECVRAAGGARSAGGRGTAGLTRPRAIVHRLRVADVGVDAALELARIGAHPSTGAARPPLASPRGSRRRRVGRKGERACTHVRRPRFALCGQVRPPRPSGPPAPGSPPSLCAFAPRLWAVMRAAQSRPLPAHLAVARMGGLLRARRYDEAAAEAEHVLARADPGDWPLRSHGARFTLAPEAWDMAVRATGLAGNLVGAIQVRSTQPCVGPGPRRLMRPLPPAGRAASGARWRARAARHAAGSHGCGASRASGLAAFRYLRPRRGGGRSVVFTVPHPDPWSLRFVVFLHVPRRTRPLRW